MVKENNDISSIMLFKCYNWNEEYYYFIIILSIIILIILYYIDYNVCIRLIYYWGGSFFFEGFWGVVIFDYGNIFGKIFWCSFLSFLIIKVLLI